MTAGSPLIGPAELASLLGGRWIVEPDPATWCPSRVFQRAVKRKNPAYARDALNLVRTAAEYRSACDDLATASQITGALVVPDELGEPTPGGPHLAALPVLAAPGDRDWLELLAIAGRGRLRGTLTVVTGTAGKTTVRGMLAHGLSHGGRKVLQNRQNWNFKRHVMEDLASIRTETDHVVLEIGLGEQGVSLADISVLAQPHAGILTNVGQAHNDVVSPKDGEALVEAVLDAKLDGFTGLRPAAPLIIASSVHLPAWARQRVAPYSLVRYGTDVDVDHRLIDQRQSRSENHVHVRARDREYRFSLQVPGEHMALNALAAVAAAEELEVGGDGFVETLSTYATKGHRLGVTPVRFSRGTAVVLDDHFNCNLVSLDAGLRTLRELADAWGGRAIAVLGDLIEHSVWGDPREFYAEIAGLVATHRIDVVATFGPQITSMHEHLPPQIAASHHPSRRRLRQWLIERAEDGDVLLLKASKEMEFARLSRHLRKFLAQA